MKDGTGSRYDPMMEKFLQNFLVEKNIAIHLVEDVVLTLEGKHIFSILSDTNIGIFFRRMALQMLVTQVSHNDQHNKKLINLLDCLCSIRRRYGE